MRLFYSIIPLLMLGLLACDTPGKHPPTDLTTDSMAVSHPQPAQHPDDIAAKPKQKSDTVIKERHPSNSAFKEVKTRRITADSFEVSGKARVFEAAFSWVIEDGHQVLKSGHSMTDAGAPAWGSFQFRFTCPKAQPNTTLTLLLFEASARDGSRQHELAIPLPADR